MVVVVELFTAIAVFDIVLVFVLFSVSSAHSECFHQVG